MSERIGAMANQAERLASAMQRIRATPAKVEVIARPVSDRATAARRTRLEDGKEIAALKRRLGLSR